MSKLIWFAERISEVSLSEVKNLLENATRKGNQEVVSLCEAELISRKPKPKPIVGMPDDFIKVSRTPAGKRLEAEVAERLVALSHEVSDVYDLSAERARALSVKTQRFISHRLLDSKGKAKTKADNEYKQELAAEAAFQNSPDGKLIYSYEHFQIVNLCHQGRKEFLVKFITYKEMSELKTKMKAIEDKLKSSLRESTDKLWAKAESNNRNYLKLGLDRIETHKDRGGDKQGCENAAYGINKLANELLGKESLKKSF